ncbi:MAG: hypothetical protein IZT59_03955 [Verrucomicrobia bacterium]|nr:hypothetical protein [Verrucomicrobiota bacterium]
MAGLEIYERLITHAAEGESEDDDKRQDEGEVYCVGFFFVNEKSEASGLSLDSSADRRFPRGEKILFVWISWFYAAFLQVAGR